MRKEYNLNLRGENDVSEPKLKSCPFCGRVAKIFDYSTWGVCEHSRQCYLRDQDDGRLIRPSNMVKWNRRAK